MPAEVASGRKRQGGAARLGRDQSAAACACLDEFVDLLNRDLDSLAYLLAREHGKTVPDAKGEIQRGLEVVEFAIGVPHLMKGEFTDGAGPGIYLFDAPAARCRRGHHAIQFPAMIPLWKLRPRSPAAMPSSLSRPNAIPRVPLKLAELMLEAGLPAGILDVVNGDKEAVDAILDDPISRPSARRLHPDRRIYLARGAPRESGCSVSAAPRTT